MLHTFHVRGPVASTRERGRRIRKELEERLATTAPGDVIKVDLSGVEAMTVSFADEFLGHLLMDGEALGLGECALVLVGLTPDARETLELVLERRKTGALCADVRGRVTGLGGPAWFADTVRVTHQLGAFRATELAERLALTPQAANNRLKRLVSSGAILRELSTPVGGGKEYLYRRPDA